MSHGSYEDREAASEGGFVDLTCSEMNDDGVSVRGICVVVEISAHRGVVSI